MQTNTTIRKKNKGYQCIVSYKVGGEWKQRSKQGFKTKQLANIGANEIIKELLETVKVDYTSLDYVDITLKELIDIYTTHHVSTLSYNSSLMYGSSFKYLEPIYDKKIKNISPLDIQIIINGMDLKYTTIITKYRSFNALFNYAIDKIRCLTENPCKHVNFTMVKDKKEMRVLSIDEFNDYIKLFKDKQYILFCMIAFQTGLRRGEVLGLTVDAITPKYIDVNKQWNLVENKKRGFCKLKTNNSYRKVPIPNTLYGYIMDYYNNCKTKNINKRIFTYHGYEYNKRFKKKGYEWVTPHVFRHSYVSNLRYAGMDLKQISELIGDDYNTVVSTYSHLTKNDTTEIENTINKVFNFN